ncbi:hypothetical protein D3875_18730 [Deinococcus cavernae]|uniref:Uncharacterized protein n=1 Tax=Deinococcus cavernae TaxID=2320857 RepID=A0A418VB82_9DEIO|nr:hypothetical protein D3875_18730 [Deinococcus cavernae]
MTEKILSRAVRAAGISSGMASVCHAPCSACCPSNFTGLTPGRGMTPNANALEQFSEFGALWKGTPERSILRPTHLNSLALLGQNHCVLLSNALACSA